MIHTFTKVKKVEHTGILKCLIYFNHILSLVKQ